MSDPNQETSTETSTSTSTSTQSAPATVPFLKLSAWLSAVTSANSKFFLKPSDLRLLYVISLWEYLRNTDPQDEPEPEPVSDAEADSERARPKLSLDNVSLPQEDLVNLIKVFYAEKNYPAFSLLNNM